MRDTKSSLTQCDFRLNMGYRVHFGTHEKTERDVIILGCFLQRFTKRVVDAIFF
jgi:hypothetical protein